MERQKMFEIWDSTNPSIEDVETYLNRLKTKPLLPLVYRSNKGDFFVKDELIPEICCDLFGIMLPSKAILRLSSVGFGDIYYFTHNGGTVAHFDEWFKKSFCRYVKSYPATQATIKELQSNSYKVRQVFSVLQRNGRYTPRFDWKNLMWLGRGSMKVHSQSDESMRLCDYLCEGRDLPVFTRVSTQNEV